MTKVSIGYLAFIVCVFYFLMGTPTDPTCVGGYLPCLVQIADVLAGLFAPLAFLWLVAAVLVQSQELKGQQEELKRQEQAGREQSKATAIQLDNARKQTDILQRQIESQLQALNSREIKSLIKQLHFVLYSRINRRVYLSNQPDKPILNVADSLLIYGSLYEISNELSKTAGVNEESIRNNSVKISQIGHDDLKEVHNMTSSILDQVGEALPAQRKRIQAIKLAQLHQAIEILLRCRIG